MSSTEEIPGQRTARTVNRTRPSRSKAARAAKARETAPRSADDAAQAGTSHSRQDAPLIEADDRRSDDSHELTRRSRSERSVDQFAIPASWRKPKWDYQYWTTSVLGQPVENSQFMEVYEGGWRPVLWKDVPKPWNPGAKADEPIERLGQRLYTRPMRLTEQARNEEYKAAEQQRMDRVRSASEGRVSGGGGIDEIKGVKAVNLGVEVTGEVGTQAPRHRE